MTRQETLEEKLTESLSPDFLDVINESHMHSVPPGSESHFKVVVVSKEFLGLPLVRRHQKVNGILSDELKGGIHALSMETLTPKEWEKRSGQTLASPACHGGSKNG